MFGFECALCVDSDTTMASKKLKINSSAPKVPVNPPKMRKKKSFTLGTPRSKSPSPEFTNTPSPSSSTSKSSPPLPKSAPTPNSNNADNTYRINNGNTKYNEIYKQTISTKSYNNNNARDRKASLQSYASDSLEMRDRGSSHGSFVGSPHIRITTPTGAINTKSNSHDYKIGQYIRLHDSRQGYIRYVGQTAFSKHILYGIELDDKYDGKHSGMYKGVKYFDTARPNKGIFVTINKIAAPINPIGGGLMTPNGSLLSAKGSKRNKHGRKLSAMIYRNNGFNKSRVSFVVPDIGQLLLSPTASAASDSDDEDNASVRTDESGSLLDLPQSANFTSLLQAYSSEMVDVIEEEEEEEDEKYSNPELMQMTSKHSAVDSNVVQLILTPTGKKDILSTLQHKIKRIKKKTKQQKGRIGVRIPFGKINSKCMARILAYLTMKELSEYAFVSQSARDSIRLVAAYDFRYMLYDALSVQQIRKILCILKFHKPKELILPMAYFIYDPVVLRLFLQFFNVEDTKRSSKQLFKYIHKLVIDDRDIRPNSWLMRPGNYPWNELCNRDTEQETAFPFELVECFQSLGNNLWELDIRYTINVELSYFMKSCESILFLSVSAENRMDMEQFYNVTHLTIQNKIKTWEEIERSELLEWKLSFKHLSHLTIINQRFEASILDLLSNISWLPALRKYLMSNCHFNEPTQFESIEHMKKKTNLDNRVYEFTIKKQSLSKTTFAIISQFFHRINYFYIIDCKLKKANYDFNFFKPMTHLTQLTITNLKSKKRLNGISYGDWLQSVYDKIVKFVYVSVVTVECNLTQSRFSVTSHVLCKYCKQLIDKTRMRDHLDIMCPEVPIVCPLCGAKVKRKSLSYHWTNNCKEYYIKCFLCPKLFTVKTRDQIYNHVLRHSMNLDEEAGKYEMIFMDNKQATNLANEYPIYTITICQKCKHRSIGPVVPSKHRKKLIPSECDACPDKMDESRNDSGNNARTKGKRISTMKKTKGKKVGPHPYPKNFKLKHNEHCIKIQ